MPPGLEWGWVCHKLETPRAELHLNEVLGGDEGTKEPSSLQHIVTNVCVHVRVRAHVCVCVLRLIPFSSSCIHQRIRGQGRPLPRVVSTSWQLTAFRAPLPTSQDFAHSLPRRLCGAMLILLPQMKMSSQLLPMPLMADPSLEEKSAVVQPLTSEAPSGTMAEEDFCSLPAGQGHPDRARQPEWGVRNEQGTSCPDTC